MCRAVGRSGSERICWNKSRRVVRKYKKMTLRKEMRRLKQILPRGETLKQYEVIDQTILLIQQLEMKLLTRIKQGVIPPKMAMMMSSKSELNVDIVDMNMMRNMVMNTLRSKV